MLPSKFMAPVLSAMIGVSTAVNIPAVVVCAADTDSANADIIYSLGDVNGDQSVTSADASLTLEEYSRISVAESPTFREGQIAAADLDSDGFITSNDASLILSYYAHLSSGGSKSISEYIAWLEEGAVTTTTTEAPVTTTTTTASTTTVPVTTSTTPAGDLYTTYNVTTGLNIRKTASTSAEILGSIPANAKFYVTNTSGSWAQVTYNGITGWVNSNYITLAGTTTSTTSAATTTTTTSTTTTTTTTKPTTTTTTSTTTTTTTTKATTTTAKPAGDLYTTKNVVTGLNIRKSYSTNSDILGSIPAGAQFYVTSIYNGWAHTVYNGVSGWVSCDYISLVSSSTTSTTTATTTTTAPVTTATTTTTHAGELYTTYGVTIYLNQRVSPMINANTVGSIPANAQFYVLKTDGLWAYAEYNGVKGYVNCAFIKKPGSDTNAHKYPLAAAKLNAVGWDMQAAFKAAAAIPYYGHTADMPQTADTSMEWYADYGFKNSKGNCYVMAAMFCEMAKSMGYEAHQISGKVPLLAGGYGPHSWVEVVVNGTTYVCDPDFTNETGYNGYMINYGQSGTWRYVKETTMS